MMISPGARNIFYDVADADTFYDNTTLVITQPPVGIFPRDYQYCYLEMTEIDYDMVFYNIDYDDIEEFTDNKDYNANISMEFTMDEFSQADITFQLDDVAEWESDKTWYDVDFEKELVDEYRDDEEVIICVANLEPNEDGVYDEMIGYTRLTRQVIIVFARNINFNLDYIQFIIAHEMGHQLGLLHIEGDCLMNPTYTGDGLCQESIDTLKELH